MLSILREQLNVFLRQSAKKKNKKKILPVVFQIADAQDDQDALSQTSGIKVGLNHTSKLI